MRDLSQITTAQFVGNFENGSAEWHELRKTGIGGSDIAAACGVSPWTSPFALWAIKTGKIDDKLEPSEAMTWGNILEPVVLDQLEEQFGYTLRRNVGTWAHKARPWQLANPDAILSEDGNTAIVEVKTARFEDSWGKVDEGEIGEATGVPQHYRTQVQWYLQVFGFDYAIVAVLFGGSKLRRYRVDADPFEQSVNLRKVAELREHILNDTQPDFDGSMSTLETVRAIHPDIVDDEVELGDLWMHTDLALTDEKKAIEYATEMKSRVLDALGNAKRGTYDFGQGAKVVCERSSRMGGKPFLKVKGK